MKKIVVGLIFSIICGLNLFAGEIGYVWMARTNGIIDNVNF